jgi:uncharacterized protein
VGEVTLRFAGYAAVWERVDRAGDLFAPGAFGDGGEVPLLWQHRGDPVGRARAWTDAYGLRVEGEIEAAEPARLVRGGAVAGLSVGYRPLVIEQGARRRIVRAALAEVSLVAVPMQPLARIERLTW